MNKYFGNKFKKLRNKMEISQRDIAYDLNVSQNLIFKWEKGICEPNYDTLIKIAEYFNITVNELLGEEPINRQKQLDKFYNEIEIEKMTEEEQKQFFLMAKTLAKGIKQK